VLQPLQLEEVKTRYANEIAELQDFLQKAGCLPGAPESLHAIVKRLQRDRAFHRDLTSYIWVVIHSGNRNISYADLLGVLALASAGGRYAAEAEGDDAHALLRFVMDARESLDGKDRQKSQPANPPAPPVAPPPPVQTQAAHPLPAEPEVFPQQPVEPKPVNVRLVTTEERLVQERASHQPARQQQPGQSQPAQSQPLGPQPRPARSRSVRSRQVEPPPVQSQPVESQAVESQQVESHHTEPGPVEPQPVKSRPVYDDDGPLYPHARPFPEFSSLKDEEEEGSSTRKRLIWLTVFFLVAALAARIAFHNLNFKALNDTASPETPAVTAPAESPAPVTNPDTPPPARVEPAPEPEVAAPAPAEKNTRTPHGMSPARGARRSPSSAYPSASPPPDRVTTPPSGPAPKIPPAPATQTAPTPAPATTPAPKTPPTARVASPSEQDLSNIDRGRAVPKLLRRTPEEKAELAEASAPANIPAPTNASAGTASRPAPVTIPQTPHGSVRAISLGVNASNVLYSPTPAYPQAASDAHIQGDVKVETNVDRNGNVASVRVVSGPPLLREAALDAAQRWRYRPHFTGGEQAAMSTITVFEFQLP